MSIVKSLGIGIVLEDKPRNTDVIKVNAMQVLYDQPSGKIMDTKRESVGDNVMTNGVQENTQHVLSQTDTATWKPIGQSNRKSAPDVKQNMEVYLWKADNSDVMFWDTWGRDPRNAGKEDVLYAWGNTLGGARDDVQSLDNSVYFRVNTYDKFIHLHTPKNDGEPCTFDFKIDFGKGTWKFEDDLGNFMEGDSVAGILNINTNEEINTTTKKHTNNSEEHTINTKIMLINASEKTTVNTPITLFDQEGNVIMRGTLHVDKDVTMDQNLAVVGNLSYGGGLTGTGAGPGGGSATINGPVKATETISSGADITADGNITAGGRVSGTNI